MIKVRFTEEGNKLSLRVKGHARYAEHGKDIVCASASILAYTLATIVESFDEDKVKSNIYIASGDTNIWCECKDEQTFISLKNAYHYTEIGYALLFRKYPEYVRLYAPT